MTMAACRLISLLELLVELPPRALKKKKKKQQKLRLGETHSHSHSHLHLRWRAAAVPPARR
jgi:hypothetical protein